MPASFEPNAMVIPTISASIAFASKLRRKVSIAERDAVENSYNGVRAGGVRRRIALGSYCVFEFFL